MEDKMTYVLYPESASDNLMTHLEMEEKIAREGIVDSAFFIWQSAPTVIYGRNQSEEAEVNVSYCRQHSIRVCQRKSGGGCVYSDEGNVMLSCITKGDDVQEAFRKFLHALANALKEIGLGAEVSGRNDIIVDGRKVSGNACYAIGGRCVVHGTLLYDVNMEHLEKSITPSQEKLMRKGVASVRQRVVNLKPLILASEKAREKGVTDVETLKTYLRNYFCDKEKTI